MDACDRDDPWVEVTVSQDDGTLLIRVADSGTGMDAEHLRKGHAARLFDEDGHRRRRNTAWAWPWSRRWCKRHDGTLTADVTYGSCHGDGAGDDSMISRPDRRGRTADRRGASHVSGTAGRAFRWRRSRTPPATRCSAAAEAAATETPIDLVLLDLGLPDASGIAWRRRCRVCAPRRTSSRSPPNAIWRWCAPPSATARWRICSSRSRLRRSGTGWSATGATARRCPPAPTRPARRRSTARWPNCGSAQTDPWLPRAPHRDQRRDRPRGPGFRRRHHRRRGGQAGRRLTGDGVALPRTARRRGHAHATDRLRQGGPPEDPLHLALVSSARRPARKLGRPCLHSDTPLKYVQMRSFARTSTPEGSAPRPVRRWRTRWPTCCSTAATA